MMYEIWNNRFISWLGPINKDWINKEIDFHVQWETFRPLRLLWLEFYAQNFMLIATEIDHPIYIAQEELNHKDMLTILMIN